MSLRRFSTVFRADVAFHLKRPLVWFLLAILGLMSWGLTTGNVGISSGDSSVGGTKAWITSEFAVGFIVPMLVLLVYSFFVAVAAGMCVIQDEEHKVGDLLRVAGLTPGEYVWAKFLAVVATFSVVLLAHLALMAFFFHVMPYENADKIRGPFALRNYLVPGAAFGLPTILFVAGYSFFIGERTRKPPVVFFLPVALFLVCLFFLWSWSPGTLDPRANRALMSIDPSGFRWINEIHLKVDKGVEYYNSAPIEFDAGFLASRAVFAAIGFLLVGLAQRRYAAASRGAVAARPAEARRGAADAAPTAESRPEPRADSPPLAALGMTVRPPGFTGGLARVTFFELVSLLKQPGMYLFIPLILVEVVANGIFSQGWLSTKILLTPGWFAVSTLDTVTVCLALLLLFYTVESIERERATGIFGVFWATPVRTASALLGKSLANGLIAAIVVLVALLSGVVIQLVEGQVPLDLAPYAIVWGVALVPTVLLWTTFVMAVRAVAGNRYGTYAISLAALSWTGWRVGQREAGWATNWPLFDALRWTDLGPFEIDRAALVLNRLAALALALFFLVIAVRTFARREFDAARVVNRLKPGSILRSLVRLLPVAAPPLVLMGALGFMVAAGRDGDAIENKTKDYWRKNVATWLDAPQPDVTRVELDLVLDPETSAFTSKGTFAMENRTGNPLRRIAFTAGPHWSKAEFTLDGAAVVPEGGKSPSLLHVLTPPAPIPPGGGITVGFDVAGKLPLGVSRSGGGASEFILPAGVVLTSFEPSFVPVPGFIESMGVDEENRYEPKEYPDDYYRGETPPFVGVSAPFSTRVRVTAPEAYTINSVGTLESETVADGLRTAVWESDYPVTFFNVIAGKWAVRRGEGTAIYHHPAHDYNVPEMIEALDAARRHYSEWFHEYPWRELKLSEFAALADYAQGFATNITFSESIGFLTRSSPKANMAFLVTAHESAHQWWGNLLTPGKGPGGNILSEGTAHFSTILLMEKVKGLQSRIETCKRLEESYGENRQVDSERPLVKIDGSRAGDTTVTYDKGGWVFFMLHELMGEERSFEGHRAFIAKYARSKDHPVLQDFVESMRPFAPDAAAYDEFVEQWFFEVVVPRYELSGAKKEKSGSGEGFVVTVTVENRGTGTMPVEIAAVSEGERFEEVESGAAPERKEYRDARTTVTLGPKEKREVEIRCDFDPAKAIVDPDAKVLMLKRSGAEAKL